MEPEYVKNVASVLILSVEALRDQMIAVATGGPRIQDVNDDYRRKRCDLKESLEQLGLQEASPYDDLWEWYGRWSSGDLPTYRSRRQYLRDMYAPLLRQLEDLGRGMRPPALASPTGWPNVDRVTEKMRLQLARARDEEDYQQVGLLAREAMISLGQAVFDPSRHSSQDGVEPSASDAKRMLEAFIATELAGQPNEAQRSHARASLKLANDLQHSRTAGFREAALCAEATTSVINIVAIVSGRRDPGEKP